MTDIHSHLIYGVDDGSKSIEESLALIKTLKEIGFDNLIMTPHFIEGSDYCSLNPEKLEKLENLRSLIKQEGIDINLYLGNEIFVNDHIPECIENGLAYSLNGSKYFLFELPFHNRIIGLIDMIYELKVAGYTPILAHPERYSYFQENYHLIDELKEEGVLFQVNFGSIIGLHGKESEKLLKYMLKHRYADYIGTDLHHLNRPDIIDNFRKIEKQFIKHAGREYYQRILENNERILKEAD